MNALITPETFNHLLLAVCKTIPHPAASPAPHEGDVVSVPDQEAEVGDLGVIDQVPGQDVLPGPA